MLRRLFDEPTITSDDLDFETIAFYTQSEHLDRKLVPCRACGALFLHQFYEINNLTTSADRIYSTYVPVASQAEAQEKNRLKNIRNLRSAIFRDPTGRVYGLVE